MSNFINYIYDFINSILNALINLGGSEFANLLYKPVFYENSLIGINITYIELFRYISTILIVILFIVVMIKIVLKFLGIFQIK